MQSHQNQNINRGMRTMAFVIAIAVMAVVAATNSCSDVGMEDLVNPANMGELAKAEPPTEPLLDPAPGNFSVYEFFGDRNGM